MTSNNSLEQLSPNATTRELQQAAAFNHTALFCQNALSVGGEVFNSSGLTWTHAGDSIDSMIAFPVLAEEDAATVIDEIVSYYLSYPPKSVGCWSLEPAQPRDLAIRLLARGFQPGFYPNWMAVDLMHLDQDHDKPSNLLVTPDNTTNLEKIEGLPYGDTDTRIFSQQHPGAANAQRFIATLENVVVAHCSVLLSAGPLGSAGIYHVGVLPAFRNRGVGKAIVGAACKFAKDRGYNYALLNGTGSKMYEQLGFRRLGNGKTWWLHGSKLIAHPPSKIETRLAEAIGRGDLQSLDLLKENLNDFHLGSQITNGMTLMGLAVHFRQPASAKWLMSNGISINVIEAWNFGWRELAAKILAEHPEYANIKYGDGEATMLHTAAERGDVSLASLVLTANPDISIRDKHYNATALDWAKHLKKNEVERLIEKYISTQSAK